MKSNKPSDVHTDASIKPDNQFPVVGIGASAGGLNAFKKLLNAIPEDSGMAYVLVQHLDPTHTSMLPEILNKATSLPVIEISDEIEVKPDNVYVMPSNKNITASDGVLLLTPRPKKNKTEQNLPIDLLFTSLATVYHEHAIGVVLSGSAYDGTKGLKAIKDSGGITIAQDAKSAEYDSMPNSAVQAGVVDFVLPPGEIPGKLVELTKIISTAGSGEDSPAGDEDVFRQIMALIQVRKGSDFTFYKQTTIRRRILRRMALNKNMKVAGYLRYLRENKQEQDLLYQDFLIPVTSFFRDPESFVKICKDVLPVIIKNKPAGEPIRLWVAGCSTGEEAYSMAICLREFLDEHSTTGTEERVQIFASDLSEPAIDKARSGTYSKMELADVSENRLNKFFSKTHDGYQVNRQIRDMCVFACHNFLTDPPFGKMYLISCRNVLIYMEPYLQKKALVTFHYALNPKGFLLLGKSETTGGVPDLFAPFSKKNKLYTRKDAPSKYIQVGSVRTESSVSQKSEQPEIKKKSHDFQKTADEIMLSKYTPAGVIVNESMDIVQYRGSTSKYLVQTSGTPSHNLLVLAREGLSFELRSLLLKARKENAEMKKEYLPVKINDSLHYISIEAIPLPNTVEPYFLVLFRESPAAESTPSSDIDKKEKKKPGDKKDLRLKQLEQELLETRENMRSVTEEQEAANEELQSANEELLSSSEELQSLNEELETSKEELQSTNEELIVMNHEMTSLNEQLESEKIYSESIIANLREALLVLDKNLRVRTANNAFYKLFNVSEEETEGSLFYKLGNKQLEVPKLRNLLEKIIPEKSIINDFELTHTFPDIGEKTLLINAREVKTENNSDKLILLSIEDITEQKIAQRKSREIQQQHTKELEAKIKERTNDLKKANEELLHINSELVKMNKELEAFAYVSSHDLQEPLRKIQTFAGRILNKESKNLSGKGQTYFNMMMDAAGRMQTLIEDLLDFSRLSTTEQNFETIDLGKIIEEVKVNLQESIKEKKAVIEIKNTCEADVIVFQFRQLMQNLIGNALKFSKSDKPPHIIIESKKIKRSPKKPGVLLPDKTYCHLSVSDNGIGFEKEYSEKIFEVFQKLHGKDEYPGTGIGLATVKKIVDIHHGAITATSKLDKGTTFDIYIPYRN